MTAKTSHSDQLALLTGRARSRAPKPPESPAAEQPVARVAVDLPFAHLDRPFDYLVPASMDDQAVAGCRVKVRFAGRDVGGFLIERSDDTEHVGRLSSLRRVVSAEPVLTPTVLETARMVADRYAGTLADVLRLAVPPRHARVESELTAVADRGLDLPLIDLQPSWAAETGGRAWLGRLAHRESPRAVWSAPARANWAEHFATSAAAVRRSGRGSLLLAPGARDVARLDVALTALLGPGAHVTLTADLGPAARYRVFLAVARGLVDIVVGTRAAAFAPVRCLGLVAVWDDGDDLYAEPRSPYPHAREVLMLRAHNEKAAMLIAAYSRTVESQALLKSGWASHLTARRDVVRAAAPQVNVTGESDVDLARDPAARSARMPAQVFTVVRAALASGPVLVHTPRYGYQPTLACAQCRHPARCAVCSGPLARRRGGDAPSCRWCGSVAEDWVCDHCRGTGLRAPVVGSLRTAEEWGRSFPQVPLMVSGGGRVLDIVDARPAIVVATPGAEPAATDGYAAAILLDTWLTISMPGLRAAEEALRRWMRVAALVRPAASGGRVVAVGDPSMPALQALVRWDPAGLAERQLAERRSARLTPVTRVATVTADADVVTQALTMLELPRGADLLGPVDAGDGKSRVILRISAERGGALSRALQQLQAARSARKLTPLRIHIDPSELL